MRITSRCLFVVSSFGYGFSYRVVEPTLARVVQHPAFRDFQQGRQSLCIVDRAVDAAMIQQIRQDAVLLQKSGLGGPAGIQSGHEQVRQNVHQIWLRSCGRPDPLAVLLGNVPGREFLYRLTDVLRMELECDGIASPTTTSATTSTRILPNHLTELSYLSYTSGAFYRQHVDCIAGKDRKYRRCVSLLLYLGDPDEDDNREWDSDRDGGVLRIYHHLDNNPSVLLSFTDVPPNPGTLVLFDSAVIPHEVLETHRSRVCVVGWFGTPIVTEPITAVLQGKN